MSQILCERKQFGRGKIFFFLSFSWLFPRLYGSDCSQIDSQIDDIFDIGNIQDIHFFYSKFCENRWAISQRKITVTPNRPLAIKATQSRPGPFYLCLYADMLCVHAKCTYSRWISIINMYLISISYHQPVCEEVACAGKNMWFI